MRKVTAADKHWADWKKRHRAPRAIDQLRKIRSEEAKRKTVTSERPPK